MPYDTEKRKNKENKRACFSWMSESGRDLHPGSASLM